MLSNLFFLLYMVIVYSHHIQHLQLPMGHRWLSSQVISILPSQLDPTPLLFHHLLPLLNMHYYLSPVSD
jgi:hypothetical protein